MALGRRSPAVWWALPTAASITRGQSDETTWAARNFTTFAAQRISVAAQISLAQEIAEALGLSVAADPRE